MDTHRQKVHTVFTRIASRYDSMNTILSLNLDKSWRRRTLQAAAPQPGEQWLDVCCGTGKLTLEIRRILGDTGAVTGLDFNSSMLEVAKRAETQVKFVRAVRWMEADAMELPFADETFDAIVSNFVFHEVRTAKDKRDVVREAFRVLKKGGAFALQDMFAQKALYGDMEQFVEELKKAGFQEVHYIGNIEKQDGLVPGYIQTPWMISGAGLIYGIK